MFGHCQRGLSMALATMGGWRSAEGSESRFGRGEAKDRGAAGVRISWLKPRR